MLPFRVRLRDQLLFLLIFKQNYFLLSNIYFLLANILINKLMPNISKNIAVLMLVSLLLETTFKLHVGFFFLIFSYSSICAFFLGYFHMRHCEAI